MADVGTSDLVAGGLITLIGWGATFFLAKRLHKFITGKSDRSNKARWFAANAAGIVFVLFGMVWSPRIVGILSRFFSGVQSDPTEVIGLIFGMLLFSFVAAAIGFGVGKMRSRNELTD